MEAEGDEDIEDFQEEDKLTSRDEGEDYSVDYGPPEPEEVDGERFYYGEWEGEGGEEAGPKEGKKKETTEEMQVSEVRSEEVVLPPMESFMSFIEGESPTDITPATGRYIWNVLLPGWIFRSYREKGRDAVDEPNLLRHVSSLCCTTNIQVRFTDDLQYNTLQRFEDEFRRRGTNANPVTLQDVKDVALFTALIDIPKTFIEFFHTNAVDRFLRSLLIYMQFFLQIWRALMKRKEDAEYKLWHPKVNLRMAIWKRDLDLLRFIVSRDYSSIVTGQDPEIAAFYAKYELGTRNYKMEKMRFELLHVFTTRVIEIALYERDNELIKEEMERMFRPPAKNADYSKTKYLLQLNKDALWIIESPFKAKGETCKSPVLRELKRPHRDLPFVGGEDCIHLLGKVPIADTGSNILRLLQYAYLLPEDKLAAANVRVGILGFKRELFDPILSGQENKTKFDEAQIKTDATNTSIVEDVDCRIQSPMFLVSKVNKKLPYNLKLPLMVKKREEDRSQFWTAHSQLRARCFSEFILGLRK